MEIECSKISVHSVVDVITNSSTTMYTNRDKSADIVKEMISEMLEAFEIDTDIEDIFWVGTVRDFDKYNDYIYDHDIKEIEDIHGNTVLISDLSYDELQKIFLKYSIGEMKKPDWFIDCNDKYFEAGEYDSSVYIKPKQEKYKSLGQKIIDLINSPVTSERWC